jgi:hypothetical protein
MFFTKLWKRKAKDAPVPEIDHTAPTNTEREARENPAKILAEAMIAGSGGAAIEAQEARGLQELVRSQVLPAVIQTEGGKEILEAAGVKFVGSVKGDDLFQYVVFPEGWRKVPMGNDYGTYLVDEKGRKRAHIFYKAASYDRYANMDLQSRFNVRFNWQRFENSGEGVTEVYDCDTLVYTTPAVKWQNGAAFAKARENNTDKRADWVQRDAAEKQAKADTLKAAADWLISAGFPDWMNPGAYWD